MLRLLLSLLFLSSIQSYANSKIDINSKLQLFKYDQFQIVPKLKQTSKFKTRRVLNGNLEVKDPLKPIEIPIKYYQVSQKEKKPLVIIIPSIWGQTPLEQTTAEYFSKAGFHSIIVNLKDDFLDISTPISQIDRFFIDTTIEVQRVIDWAAEQEEIDSSSISIFGVSLGGIRSSLISMIEPRIKSAALFVAGGNIPEILTNSTVDLIEDYRIAKMHEEGFESKQDYHNKLKATLTIDPLDFVSLRSPEEFMMVVALHDKSVPTKNQIELWKALDQPTAYRWHAPHGGAIITYPIYLKRIKQFYENSWK